MAKKWTVMVYMAAQDSQELDAHAVRDIQEMERSGGSDYVDVVVQIDRAWPGCPQRYQIADGQSRLLEGHVAETNMGDGKTLKAFLAWALQAFPADCYFLVLWGHAYGLGFGRDHNDGLSVEELRSALATFRDARSGTPLELLGANACAMSYAEAAFELQDVAQFLVASQIAVPFAGWPYESILKRIASDTTPSALGRIVADSYVRSFAASASSDQVAMSVLDLRKVGPLKQHFKGLTDSLYGALRQPEAVASDRMTHIRTAFFSTAAGDVRPLIDFKGLTQELDLLCEDLGTLEPGVRATDEPHHDPVRTLKAAAIQLSAFLTPAAEQVGTFAMPPPSGIDLENQFVVFHKRHPDLEGLHGVGVFAPFVTDEHDLRQLGLLDDPNAAPRRVNSVNAEGRTAYRQLELVNDTGWEQLVYEDLREALPQDLASCLESSGAATRADKLASAQMLVSVDSLFDKLDRTIAASKKGVKDSFRPSESGSSAAASTGGGAGSASAVVRFSALRLLDSEDLDGLLKKASPPLVAAVASSTGQAATAVARTPGPGVDTAVRSLRALEQSMAHVERGARQTLTHGVMGLGPGAGLREGKSGMGREGKPGMGREGKPGMGREGKPGMGREGKPGMGPLVIVASDSTSSADTVVDLFQEMGDAFVRLEEAAADVERTTAGLNAGHSASSGLAAADFHNLAETQIERAFRVLGDAATDARRTLRRVLAHPLYGFGPGPGDLGSEERRELARLGGLSSRELKLL